jgi:ABC-type branched-subunit amino acid transport system substrate-binding protein
MPIRSLKMFVVLGAIVLSTLARAEDKVSDTELRIGDVTIFTGPAKFIGEEVSLGSRIAAAEINAAGGVGKRKLEIFSEDDGYVPSRSVQALRKLLDEGVFAISGTSGSSNLLAMLPTLLEEKVPVVVSTAANDKVYENGAPPNIFSLGPNYDVGIYATLAYVAQHVAPKDAKYGLLVQDDDFGDSIEKGYEEARKKFGFSDALRVRFKRGQQDFSAEMLRLKAAGVTVLVDGSYFGAQANVHKEARKLGMDDLIIVTHWLTRMRISMGLIASSKFPFYTADFIVPYTDPAFQAFLEKGKKLIGDTAAKADRYTILNYLGVKAIAAAAGTCGSNLTRACVSDELAKLSNFDAEGLTAPLSFNNSKHLAASSVKVYHFDPAKNEFVAVTGYQ